jgi:hypothetical protein
MQQQENMSGKHEKTEIKPKHSSKGSQYSRRGERSQGVGILPFDFLSRPRKWIERSKSQPAAKES